MTWNFALLALDQSSIQRRRCSTCRVGSCACRSCSRPNGAALQLSSQHSQAWESWLAHIPGLKVSRRRRLPTPRACLKSAIRDNNPVIVLEGEMLYNLKGEVPRASTSCDRARRSEARGDRRDVDLPSKTVAVALKAADQLAEQTSPPRSSTCARYAHGRGRDPRVRGENQPRRRRRGGWPHVASAPRS